MNVKRVNIAQNPLVAGRFAHIQLGLKTIYNLVHFLLVGIMGLVVLILIFKMVSKK